MTYTYLLKCLSGLERGLGVLTSICPYKYEDLSSNRQKPRKAGGAVVRIGNLRDLMVPWGQRQNFPKAPGPAGLPYEASDKNKTTNNKQKNPHL